MRPRFEEGEELVFVTDIVQLERIVADENCTSGASTSSAGQAPATPAPTRSQRQSKRQIDRLRREITTLNVELARLHLDETRLADTTAMWKTIAMTQLLQRQRAEHNNKVLKRMLTAQHLLAKSILNGRVDLLQAIPKKRRALKYSRTPHKWGHSFS
ncbi:hypothetical protein PI124_g5625 [Phytophthora idaei]|uniref:Uncharacterized protein n=1 Tax=Phytophthora aleatoria TaxID=2496075 RepID=A0A8J5J775_9STRA|nr:hypothetical protein PI125_g4703 [Phytophthora idaei]KAG3169884.1 hypothetical protein PI126_g2580 [Phytophthora idaei]KAG3249715.1 hypothetical protein PI124_g5625 [Phytophthora idaei]KAG6963156.1 hypothetical protein JG688_00008277 [Phytophthora aleatoria]